MLSIRTLRKLNRGGEVVGKADMSKYSTYQCGGKAKVLLVINTLEKFIKVSEYLKGKTTNIFVLGAGSNVLVSDRGYKGVVIKLAGDLARIEMVEENVLECGAGVKLSSIFAYASSSGLSGLEDGAGIPATIGGAVYMNASAYNFEIAKMVQYVVAYVDGRFEYFDNSQCKFAYRYSIFQENNAVIIRVGLKFTKANKEDIMGRFLEVSRTRACSQPLDKASAGCVFKRLDGVQVSRLLDEMGFKGLTIGKAQVSSKHANFIINLGGSTAQDIYLLINLIKTKVKEKHNINLETEIKFLGEFQ